MEQGMYCIVPVPYITLTYVHWAIIECFNFTIHILTINRVQEDSLLFIGEHNIHRRLCFSSATSNIIYLVKRKNQGGKRRESTKILTNCRNRIRKCCLRDGKRCYQCNFYLMFFKNRRTRCIKRRNLFAIPV